MMKILQIHLSNKEWKELQKLSAIEMRLPSLQIRILIVEELNRQGAQLPKPTKMNLHDDEE